MEDKVFNLLEKMYADLTEKIDAGNRNLNEKIDSVSKDLNEKIDSVSKDLNEKIDSVSKDLNEKIDSVNSEMQEVKAEVKQNSNHILRLENKIEDKFGALFDNREIVNEKLESIETKVDKIASDISNVTIILSKHYKDIEYLKKAK